MPRTLARPGSAPSAAKTYVPPCRRLSTGPVTVADGSVRTLTGRVVSPDLLWVKDVER